MASLSFTIPDKMGSTLNELAKARGQRLSQYCEQLFVAAFSARVKPTGQDPALESAVAASASAPSVPKVIERVHEAERREDETRAKLDAERARSLQLERQITDLKRELQIERGRQTPPQREPTQLAPPAGKFVTIEEYKRRMAERNAQIDAGLEIIRVMRIDLADAQVEAAREFSRAGKAEGLVSELREQLEIGRRALSDASRQTLERGDRLNELSQQGQRWRAAFVRTRAMLDKAVCDLVAARAPGVKVRVIDGGALSERDRWREAFVRGRNRLAAMAMRRRHWRSLAQKAMADLEELRRIQKPPLLVAVENTLAEQGRGPDDPVLAKLRPMLGVQAAEPAATVRRKCEVEADALPGSVVKAIRAQMKLTNDLRAVAASFDVSRDVVRVLTEKRLTP